MSFEDRFQLKVPLGESAHGAVWSGVDDLMKRPVAVTLLANAADEAIRKRFEAMIDGGVKSLRVMAMARVVDAGRSAEGLAYLVTELQTDATSLASRLADGPAISVAAATNVVIDLLGAVTRMEKIGLTHGDVEPGNVLLVESGGRLSPRLVGLGLNRAAIREGIVELDSSEHLSTLGYMAPEQAGDPPSGSTGADAFSAVAILFSWITGRLPFRGADARSMREAARSRHVPRVGKVRPELADTVLAAVLDKALSRDPTDRFPDAATLTARLRAALAQTPTARDLDVRVGARITEPDASDAELGEERATGPTALAVTGVSVEKPSALASRKLTLSRPPLGSTPPAKIAVPPPATADDDDKSSTDDDKRADGGEGKGAAKSADTTPSNDLADVDFEKISGLLMIPDDGPPQRVKAQDPPARPGDSGKLPLGIFAGGVDEIDELISRVTPGLERPSEEPADPPEHSPPEHSPPEHSPPEHGPPAGGGPAAEPSLDAAANGDVAPVHSPPREEAAADAPAGDEPAPGVPPEPEDALVTATPVPPEVSLETAPMATHQDRVEDYVLPKSSMRWGLVAGGVGAVVIALCGVVWVVAGGDPEDPAAAVEPTVEAEPETPEVTRNVGDAALPEERPAQVEEQTVNLSGVPEGATVTVDGETIEGTVLTLGGESHEVEVRAAGFEPWHATMDATSDPSVAVVLTAMEPETEVDATDSEPEEEPEAGTETLTAAQRQRLEARAERRRALRAERARNRRSLGVGPNPY